MTFEEWLNGPSGFGNFTRKELLAENMPSKFRDFIDDLSTAYEAGWRQGHKEGYIYRETVQRASEGGQ